MAVFWFLAFQFAFPALQAGALLDDQAKRHLSSPGHSAAFNISSPLGPYFAPANNLPLICVMFSRAMLRVEDEVAYLPPEAPKKSGGHQICI